LIEIINKQLLLQLVGYLCYWQMGFNSVFKGLIPRLFHNVLIPKYSFIFLSFLYFRSCTYNVSLFLSRNPIFI